MGSLTSLYDLSRSSLLADQAALNATSNNVANQNTVGYTRQVVSWQTGDSVTLGGTTLVDGPTVTTSSVRDRVLEQRVQQQTQVQAGTGARAAVLSQIEDVFGITGTAASAGSTEVGTALNGFFSSLTALEANPADAGTRAAVLSAAGTLAGAFNTASTALGKVQQSVNGEIGGSTAAVNALTQTIAGLNAQISANSPGSDAGTLEDQRQTAIAQLSQYVGLDQVSTEKNGITLTTQGGTVLVEGDRSYGLSAVQSGGTTQVLDAAGMDVSGTIVGGSMGGQLVAQNSDLPSVNAALDGLAARIGNAVNVQNAAGVLSSGSAGGAIFSVPATGAAAGISVSATGVGAIATAAVGEGATGTGNASALVGLAQALDGSGSTVSGQLAGMLAEVGTSSSALREQSAAQTASLTQLTTQRDSLSGVSLDEEAAHLSAYQRSYEAAAKLFSIVDTLMASAINLGESSTVA